jgi:hypothetical protein
VVFYGDPTVAVKPLNIFGHNNTLGWKVNPQGGCMLYSHDLFDFGFHAPSHGAGFDHQPPIDNSGNALLDALSNSGQSLGHEYLMSDSGQLSPVNGAKSSVTSFSRHHSPTPTAPAPTLVGAAGGLQIDLIWDSSVAKAPSGFMQAIIDAATYYTTVYSTKEVININVGYGEIAGSQMPSNGLGASESYGYLTNYATVTNALIKDGFSFSASNEPTGAQFFVTSAEAKALGMVNPTSTALDGYVGFSTLSGTGYSWNLTATTTGSNTGTASNQFDLQSVALHEISEVMGRIGMEGATVNGKATYTPLDLFNFKSPGALELSGGGGYFSTNNGVANLGVYNNASAYGGDIADWASATSPTQSNTLGLPSGGVDAYNAFGWPGTNGDVSTSDVTELAALGYKLTATV